MSAKSVILNINLIQSHQDYETSASSMWEGACGIVPSYLSKNIAKIFFLSRWQILFMFYKFSYIST